MLILNAHSFQCIWLAAGSHIYSKFQFMFIDECRNILSRTMVHSHSLLCIWLTTVIFNLQVKSKDISCLHCILIHCYAFDWHQTYFLYILTPIYRPRARHILPMLHSHSLLCIYNGLGQQTLDLKTQT